MDNRSVLLVILFGMLLLGMVSAASDKSTVYDDDDKHVFIVDKNLKIIAEVGIESSVSRKSPDSVNVFSDCTSELTKCYVYLDQIWHGGTIHSWTARR